MFKNLKRLGIISDFQQRYCSLLVEVQMAIKEQNERTDGAADGDVKYGEEMNYHITGIEPGAGVFKASENAIEEYGLEGWEVQASSSGAMATALGEAY